MQTYFVDAFTSQKFKGNPAAVCLTEHDLDGGLMQGIAAEIGFSETAFVKKVSGPNYGIRFFTPKKEIPLCGHATLASSKIIFDTTTFDTIHFNNCENLALEIRKEGAEIVMQFPVYETVEREVPESMRHALGIRETLDTRFSPKNNIILIQIDDVAALAALRPDFSALLLSQQGINGVLVTARSGNDGFDFHYRYFWPWAGTNEDPVTGGVQTFLTPYWAAKLRQNRLKAFQSSPRTGRMTTELVGDKVLIHGEAVVVLEGTLKI